MVINKKDCIFSLFLPAYVAIAFQEMFEFCCRYFAVCFLNQLILTKRDRELATRLISIYFSFFGVGFLYFCFVCNFFPYCFKIFS